MKILVPIDGSKMMKKTIDAAKEIGEKFQAELTLLMIIPSGSTFDQISFEGTNYPYTKELKNANEENAKRVLSEAEKEMSGYSHEFKTVYLMGKAWEKIINYAEEEGMDMIVMGNRGLGAFSRTLLGSVSSKVINHSPITVVVVKGELEK